MFNKKQYSRQYDRNLRAICRASNLCIRCHKREPEPGKVTCAQCLAYKKHHGANQREKIGDNMTKAQLIMLVKEKGAYPTAIAAEVALNATIDAIHEALAHKESVSLSGFGIFRLVDRAARKGRNPHTGEVIDIPASRAIRFLPGKKLKGELETEARD